MYRPPLTFINSKDNISRLPNKGEKLKAKEIPQYNTLTALLVGGFLRLGTEWSDASDNHLWYSWGSPVGCGRQPGADRTHADHITLAGGGSRESGAPTGGISPQDSNPGGTHGGCENVCSGWNVWGFQLCMVYISSGVLFSLSLMCFGEC